MLGMHGCLPRMCPEGRQCTVRDAQVVELHKGLEEQSAMLRHVDDNIDQVHMATEDTLESVQHGLTQLKGLQEATAAMRWGLQESLDLQSTLLEGSRALGGRLGELQDQHEAQAKLAETAWTVWIAAL
jgi:hypothetical protein